MKTVARNLRKSSLLVSIILLTFACSKAGIRGTGAGPALSTTWSVQLSVSGGLAGVRKFVEVNQNGRVIAVDEKLDITVSGKLSLQDLWQIQRLVERRNGTRTVEPGASRGSGCFDCFIYTLVSILHGQKISKQYNGLNLENENERQLIQVLSKILDGQLNNNK